MSSSGWLIKPSTYLVVARDPGVPAAVSFLVAHGGAAVRRGTVSLTVPDRSAMWFTLEAPTRDCPPGIVTEFGVTVLPDPWAPAVVELTATVSDAVAGAPGFTSEAVVIVVDRPAPWELQASPTPLELPWDWGAQPITVTARGPFGRRVRLEAATFAGPDPEFNPLGQPREDPALLASLRIDRPERMLPIEPETFMVTLLPFAESEFVSPPNFVRFSLVDAEEPASPVVAATGVDIIVNYHSPLPD